MDKLRRLSGKVVRNWPGYKIIKEYSLLPIFFIGGAALEFVMINWHAGEVNFYKTYKKHRVEEIVERKLREIAKQENQKEFSE